AVDDPRALRHIFDAVNEHCSLSCQIVHYVAVVDDLFADVDRSAEGFKRNTDNIDGTHDTGAESPWLEQQDGLLFGWQSHSLSKYNREDAITRLQNYRAGLGQSMQLHEMARINIGL